MPKNVLSRIRKDILILFHFSSLNSILFYFILFYFLIKFVSISSEMGLFWKFILKIYCTAIVPFSPRNSTLFIFPFPFPFPFPFLLPFPFLFLLHPTDNCDFEHFSISRTDVHIWWLSFIILMRMFGIFILFSIFLISLFA